MRLQNEIASLNKDQPIIDCFIVLHYLYMILYRTI